MTARDFLLLDSGWNFRIFWHAIIFAGVASRGGKVGGIVVPSAWEAGVYTHQKVYEWYSLINHPVAFVAYLAMLILSVVTNSRVQAEIERAKANSVPAGRMYWIAKAVVQLVILGFVAYLLFYSLQIVG